VSAAGVDRATDRGRVGGRRVLVTGGASGIGARIAAEFAAHGDHVTILDRTPSGAQDIVSVVGDVRSPADQQRATARAAGDDGLDVLVANAGVHDGGLRIEDGDIEELLAAFRHVLEVDVVGYLLSIRACAPALRRANGAIVLTLSDATYGVMGNGAGVAYATAKHGCLGLLRAAARELAPDVRVNAVAPGGVATSLAAENGRQARAVIADPEQLSRGLSSRTLLQHGASLEEIASAYLYLASPAASSITGQVLRVDGGLLA
jgi:NAD(P)-dependent dehydrogenase (short-subunit alcohol dehydrogenase family)